MLKASYGAGDKPVTFVTESDQELFKALKGEAFEVQVRALAHGLPAYPDRTHTGWLGALVCACTGVCTCANAPPPAHTTTRARVPPHSMACRG